jgi:DeoR/GlpR family transcriptional regulator of sugar metabolism
MTITKRHQLIQEWVNQERTISVNVLSQRLGVSTMTIMRDLAALESQGILRRARGSAAAISPEQKLIHPVLSHFDLSQDPHFEKKEKIGKYAAYHLVNDGDNISIEAGTTASNIFPYLRIHSNLTVLTNGVIATIMAAPFLNEITLICSGGILIKTGAFIGPQAQDFFSSYRVNTAFLGAKGLTLEDGFTDPTPLYVPLKCCIKGNADRTIMMIDSSKFGVRSLIQVMKFDEIDILVTDSGAPADWVAALRDRGIDVRIAE